MGRWWRERLTVLLIALVGRILSGVPLLPLLDQIAGMGSAGRARILLDLIIGLQDRIRSRALVAALVFGNWRKLAHRHLSLVSAEWKTSRPR
jgi:hypothetical protein